MYTGHTTRSERASAAPSITSPPSDVTQAKNAGPSGYNSATVAVAIVVALLLLLAVAAIAVTEHRKQKAADALRARIIEKNSEGLGQGETRDSLGSFDSTTDLKELEPVAKGLSKGMRFALFCRNY
ncbi:hypothetical protein CI238_06194 [Colletotrichum incanum]|uniref:Uncharacterized protein n=1 Tax=Colletotrichum incanum TaxID=1573173 RepID=A0A162NI69_COLIC|nr:hypothetical protein CI238_06194 [Colletotrichum incanum]